MTRQVGRIYIFMLRILKYIFNYSRLSGGKPTLMIEKQVLISVIILHSMRGNTVANVKASARSCRTDHIQDTLKKATYLLEDDSGY